MRFTNLILFLFILSAIALGINYSENGGDIERLDPILDNLSIQMQNLTLEKGEEPYVAGILKILEEYVQFITVGAVEVIRLGMTFGFANPEYFEAAFLLKIIKIIVWLVIISLLIKPVSYFFIALVLLALWIKDKLKERREKKLNTRGRKDE